MTLIASIGVICLTAYYNAKVYGNKVEKEIPSVYENNQNILSQYSNKIGEIAQIPKMYANDLSKLYKEAMGGRYGEGGSKAMFQFLQEKNPTIDASLYTTIQQAMRAGRSKFENAQKILIEKKKVYEIKLGHPWDGMWLEMAGYPKINLDDYKILKSDYANEAFEKGVENGIKLTE